jgi:hypothetical protein
MDTLTTENARAGLTIRSRAYPEWGSFTLEQDRNAVWMYSTPKGSAVLNVSEFRLWEIIPQEPEDAQH